MDQKDPMEQAGFQKLGGALFLGEKPYNRIMIAIVVCSKKLSGH